MMTPLHLPPEMFTSEGKLQEFPLRCYCNSRWFYKRKNGHWHCEICDRKLLVNSNEMDKMSQLNRLKSPGANLPKGPPVLRNSNSKL